ncbi:MAG: crotonase/enoyl-CoA hydratase family protein [Gammaproteobacteria bacterium]
MSDRLLIDVVDHVAHVRLNRPAKLNALDFEMFHALNAAPATIAAMDDVRAVVVSGEGKSFCSGLDVQSMMQSPEFFQKAFAPVDGTSANFAQHAALGLGALPMPVIAAIQGHCFGGGLQIALGADFRLMADDADMSVMEIRWGIIPDMGITAALRDIVARDQVKELTMTGRVIGADEAHDLGLATRVCADPVAEALVLAHEIAQQSPDAIRAAKRLFDEAWHGSVEEGLALEARLQQTLLGRPAQMEAMQAAFEKRLPEFGPAGSS